MRLLSFYYDLLFKKQETQFLDETCPYQAANRFWIQAGIACERRKGGFAVIPICAEFKGGMAKAKKSAGSRFEVNSYILNRFTTAIERSRFCYASS